MAKKTASIFIGCLYNGNKVKPLNVMFPKRRAYLKGYNGQIKWMYFLIEDNDLWDKYNTVWDKARKKRIW